MRDRAERIDRATADAKKYGADGHWAAYWRLVGLTAEELTAIRVRLSATEVEP